MLTPQHRRTHAHTRTRREIERLHALTQKDGVERHAVDRGGRSGRSRQQLRQTKTEQNGVAMREEMRAKRGRGAR
jgi:hypothetical protein